MRSFVQDCWFSLVRGNYANSYFGFKGLISNFFPQKSGVRFFYYSYKSWSWKYFHRESYQWNWYLGRKFVKIQKPILRFPRFLNFMEATKVTCSSLSMLNELKFTGIDIFIILSTNLSANLIACWSFWDASFYRFEKK